MGNKNNKTIFLAYLDEANNKREGYVTLIKRTEIYISFKTSKNLITIPMGRVLKIKEVIDDE